MGKKLRFVMVGAALALVGSFNGLGAQEKGPETVVLSGSPLGSVTFQHAAHQELTDCSTCHHESRPEKPLTAEHQACTDCHVKEPVAPMTTSTRDAFHDQTAKAGTCVGCHVQAAAEGKTVPTKCTDCHKKGTD